MLGKSGGRCCPPDNAYVSHRLVAPPPVIVLVGYDWVGVRFVSWKMISSSILGQGSVKSAGWRKYMFCGPEKVVAVGMGHVAPL